MNRVMERVIELEITAKAVADHKVILFSTAKGRFSALLYIKCHVSETQGCQAGRPGCLQRCFSRKYCNSPDKRHLPWAGSSEVGWVGAVVGQFGQAKAGDCLPQCVTAWQC